MRQLINCENLGEQRPVILQESACAQFLATRLEEAEIRAVAAFRHQPDRAASVRVMIVLDTNAISELEGRLHSERLLAWLDSFQIETLSDDDRCRRNRFVSQCCLKGRRTRLAFTFDRIEAQFDGRILRYSLGAAHGYGALCAEQIQQGHIMETQDAMIAATCLTRGASLATRNTKDFEGLDLKLINPFEDS